MVIDNPSPTIGPAGSDGTVECPASPTFTAPTASDTCGGATVMQDSDTSTAQCGNTYTETRTWHAYDACGNTSETRSQTIMVIDNQAPTIGPAGSDGTVECPASPTFTAPTASDTCSGATVMQDSDTSTAGCGGTYPETRTWDG